MTGPAWDAYVDSDSGESGWTDRVLASQVMTHTDPRCPFIGATQLPTSGPCPLCAARRAD